MAISEAIFLTSELEGMRAGGYRQQRWCEAFLAEGLVVRVFNLRGTVRCSTLRFTNTDELLDFRREVAGRVDGTQTGNREGRIAALLRRVKHLFIADMFYPSVAVMLARSLRAVLSTRHRVVLMASSPPFSVAVVGAIVKRLFPHRVFLFVDMRDAWALHPALGPQTAVRRCIERFVFRQADERVTVSRGLANEFERAHGTPVRICYNVATHYDQVQVPIDVRLVDVFEGIRPTALSVVYTGSTPAGFYDTETFVAAFKELQSRSPDLALRLQFMFVGACEEVRLEVERQSAEAGAFHFREHLPTRFAVAAQSQANAVLFFGFNGDGNMGVVSTKFFEYLALGKPILPVGIRAGSDVDLLLEAACGRSIRARTRDELVRLLERVCREGVDCLPSLKDRRALDLLRDEYKRAVSHAIGR